MQDGEVSRPVYFSFLRAGALALVVIGLLLFLTLLSTRETAKSAGMPAAAAASGPAAVGCSAGISKTIDGPNYDSGTIIWCPPATVTTTVQVCDFFVTAAVGCPGGQRLDDTTIRFHCVEGCSGNYVFDTSTCPILTGIEAGVQVVITYDVIGGTPPNPSGNHQAKNYVEFNTMSGDTLDRACSDPFPAPVVATRTPTSTNTSTSTPTLTNTSTNTP